MSNSNYIYSKIIERAKNEKHNFAFLKSVDGNPFDIDLYDIFNINVTDTDTFESPNCVCIERALAVHMPNQTKSIGNYNWDYYTDMENMMKGLPKPQYIAVEDGYVVGMVWCDFKGAEIVDITEDELVEAIAFVKEKANERDIRDGLDPTLYSYEILASKEKDMEWDSERFSLNETKNMIDFISDAHNGWDLEFMVEYTTIDYSDYSDCGICMKVDLELPFNVIEPYW